MVRGNLKNSHPKCPDFFVPIYWEIPGFRGRPEKCIGMSRKIGTKKVGHTDYGATGYSRDDDFHYTYLRMPNGMQFVKCGGAFRAYCAREIIRLKGKYPKGRQFGGDAGGEWFIGAISSTLTQFEWNRNDQGLFWCLLDYVAPMMSTDCLMLASLLGT